MVYGEADFVIVVIVTTSCAVISWNSDSHYGQRLVNEVDGALATQGPIGSSSPLCYQVIELFSRSHSNCALASVEAPFLLILGNQHRQQQKPHRPACSWAKIHVTCSLGWFFKILLDVNIPWPMKFENFDVKKINLLKNVPLLPDFSGPSLVCESPRRQI